MAQRVRAHVNPLAITDEHSFEGFKNNNPIVIDVGSCKGEFTQALIEKFPEKNFILFEIRVPLKQQLEVLFKGNDNVVIFDGDAGRNFRSIIEPSLERGVMIEEVYINFPDPWFKDRHKKRRFINSKFLEELSAYIPQETTFVFQTDQLFLFEETLEVLRASSFSDIEFFDTPPYGIETDWEQATKKLGREIWRMRFRKIDKKNLISS